MLNATRRALLLTTLLAFGPATAASAATVIIDSAPPERTASTSATFTFHAEDGSTDLHCGVDGAAPTACTSPLTVDGLGEGTHQLVVREGRDFSGSAVKKWTVDLTPPQTTLDNAPAARTKETTATFAFSSSEAGAAFVCSLNGAAPSPCTSPVVYSGLSDGERRLVIRATDAAGNQDPSPIDVTWTVDSTPPDTTITSVFPAAIASGEVPLSFEASEAGSTFACAIGRGMFGVCPGVLDAGALPEGLVSIRVRATDPAGNADPTPADATLVVDRTGPATPALSLSAFKPALGKPTAKASAAPSQKALRRFKALKLKPAKTGPVSSNVPLNPGFGIPTFVMDARYELSWKGQGVSRYSIFGAPVPPSTGSIQIDFAPGTPPVLAKDVPAGSMPVHFSPGAYGCFGVLGYDAAGNSSPAKNYWSEFNEKFEPVDMTPGPSNFFCALRPHAAASLSLSDESRLSIVPGWGRAVAGPFSAGLTIPRVGAIPSGKEGEDDEESWQTVNRLAVVVLRCKGCGSATVSILGKKGKQLWSRPVWASGKNKTPRKVMRELKVPSVAGRYIRVASDDPDYRLFGLGFR